MALRLNSKTPHTATTLESDRMSTTSTNIVCRHLWQPYADAERIWKVCVHCGLEEHVTTHAEQLAATIRYVMGGRDEP